MSISVRWSAVGPFAGVRKKFPLRNIGGGTGPKLVFTGGSFGQGAGGFLTPQPVNKGRDPSANAQTSIFNCVPGRIIAVLSSHARATHAYRHITSLRNNELPLIFRFALGPCAYGSLLIPSRCHRSGTTRKRVAQRLPRWK